jgi:hypothetical protein
VGAFFRTDFGIARLAYTAPGRTNVRWLRQLLLALGFSLLAGLVIGTLIRLRIERATPRWYIGALPLTSAPRHVADAGAPVLDARDHEEQIRQAIQPAETRCVERLTPV